MRVHDVIPLRRIKMIVVDALAERFGPVEKAPPKRTEFRDARPVSRIAGRQRDALGGMAPSKFAARVRKNAKLRLFRIFKLLGDLKSAAAAPATYRAVADRLRSVRAARRL
jgi:hypothetical protein